jgi:hypothetical protein
MYINVYNSALAVLPVWECVLKEFDIGYFASNYFLFHNLSLRNCISNWVIFGIPCIFKMNISYLLLIKLLIFVLYSLHNLLHYWLLVFIFCTNVFLYYFKVFYAFSSVFFKYCCVAGYHEISVIYKDKNLFCSGDSELHGSHYLH